MDSKPKKKGNKKDQHMQMRGNNNVCALYSYATLKLSNLTVHYSLKDVPGWKKVDDVAVLVSARRETARVYVKDLGRKRNVYHDFSLNLSI